MIYKKNPTKGPKTDQSVNNVKGAVKSTKQKTYTKQTKQQNKTQNNMN